MKRHYKTKEKRKLIPGEFHNFLVLKKIVLPDDKEYYVLSDSFGDKHLLPAAYYKNYPICMNKYYLCHIDKINCQGRIFLEPVHPYYQIGKEYDFKVLELVILPSKKLNENEFYRMEAINGELAYLPAEPGIALSTGDTIRCKISQMKKSIIRLENS